MANFKYVFAFLLIAVLAVTCVHASTDVFDVLTDFIMLSDSTPRQTRSTRSSTTPRRQTSSRQPSRNPGRTNSRRPVRNPTRPTRPTRNPRPVRNPRPTRPTRPVRNPRPTRNPTRPTRPVRNPTRPVRNPTRPTRPTRNPTRPVRNPTRPVRNPNTNTNNRRQSPNTVQPGLDARSFSNFRNTNSAANRGNGVETGPGQKPSLGQIRQQFNLQSNMRPPPRGIDRGDANGRDVAKKVANQMRSQLPADPSARAAQIASAMANDAPKGKCAGYVAAAIEAGTGKTMNRPAPTVGKYPSAKDYGPSLTGMGYKQVSNPSTPRIGDVQVIPGVPGHKDGHIQIYTPNGWVSDFNQGISSVDNPKSSYYGQTPVTYRME